MEYVINEMYKRKDGLLFEGGVIFSVIAFYASLVIPTCFSQTFIEGQPSNWANRLITITNKV